MDFPDHATQGDRVTDEVTSGRTWEFDGAKWVLVGATLADVDFNSELPVEVTKTIEQDGKIGVVTYGFNMKDLPKINPN